MVWRDLHEKVGVPWMHTAAGGCKQTEPFIWGEMARAGGQHVMGNKQDENTGVPFFFHVWKCQEKWPENQRGNAKEGERHEGGRERKIEWRMNVV